MKSQVVEQETIKKYLLGMLSPEQQPRIEERILTDNSIFEELLIAEDELIDQYLGDKLSEAEQKNFEKHFLLTPDRQQKVRFARALRKYVTAAGSAEASEARGDVAQSFSKKWSFLRFPRALTPAVTYSLAVILLLGLGISWMLIRNRQRQVGQHNSLSVVLTPMLVRDAGETKRISIPAGVDTVQLRLAMTANEYQSYRAVLQSSEGTEVLVRDNLAVDTAGGEKFITFDVPAAALRRDDYKIMVRGNLTQDRYEDVNRYLFRVVE